MRNHTNEKPKPIYRHTSVGFGLNSLLQNKQLKIESPSYTSRKSCGSPAMKHQVEFKNTEPDSALLKILQQKEDDPDPQSESE